MHEELREAPRLECQRPPPSGPCMVELEVGEYYQSIIRILAPRIQEQARLSRFSSTQSRFLPTACIIRLDVDQHLELLPASHFQLQVSEECGGMVEQTTVSVPLCRRQCVVGVRQRPGRGALLLPDPETNPPLPMSWSNNSPASDTPTPRHLLTPTSKSLPTPEHSCSLWLELLFPNTT